MPASATSFGRDTLPLRLRVWCGGCFGQGEGLGRDEGIYEAVTHTAERVLSAVLTS